MSGGLHRRAVLAGLGGVALAATFGAGAGGQTVTSLESSIVTRVAEAGLSPGWVVGMAGRGEPPRIVTGGVAVMGRSGAPDPADAWHIGSITKSFTATLVARLAAAGRIDRDVTVAAALGPVLPSVDPGWDGIGFDDLLTHRAGLPTDPSWGALMSFGFGPASRLSPREGRRVMAAGALRAAPGPRDFLYSNLGYVVAGAMLEALTDTAWEDLLRAEVLDPLGLASAGFGPPQGSVQGHARGLTGAWKPLGTGSMADNPGVFGPAGTLHMAPADLLTWLAAHAARDQGFLPPEAWDWLHAPAPGPVPYAKGWVVETDHLWHNGSNAFWYVHAGFDPATGRVAMLGANAADPGLEALFGELLPRALAG